MQDRILRHFLNKVVYVELSDGSVHIGELTFIGTWNRERPMQHQNMYYIGDVGFLPQEVNVLRKI